MCLRAKLPVCCVASSCLLTINRNEEIPYLNLDKINSDLAWYLCSWHLRQTYLCVTGRCYSRQNDGGSGMETSLQARLCNLQSQISSWQNVVIVINIWNLTSCRNAARRTAHTCDKRKGNKVFLGIQSYANYNACSWLMPFANIGFQPQR